MNEFEVYYRDKRLAFYGLPEHRGRHYRKFKPTPPSMEKGVHDLLIELVSGDVNSATFRDGLKRCFEKTGMTCISSALQEKKFVKYEEKISHGTSLSAPDGTLDEAVINLANDDEYNEGDVNALNDMVQLAQNAHLAGLDGGESDSESDSDSESESDDEA